MHHIVLSFEVPQALHDFETSVILVYLILNSTVGQTGCGQHGYSLVSIICFNRSIQYGCWLFLNATFLLISRASFCFCFSLHVIVMQWRGSGGLNQCKLIGEGSP